jgi:predicted DNA-binding ribbon-helix-helix protein
MSPPLFAPLVRKSVYVGIRKTTISVETAFWEPLKEIAAQEGIPISQLVSRIDQERTHANLSSAIRLFVLEHYRRQAEEVAAAGEKVKR